MPSPHTDVQIALLIEGQKALQRELDEVEARGIQERTALSLEIKALQEERNKALKWGVLTLGSAVISLVIWIGNKIIGGHIQ